MCELFEHSQNELKQAADSKDVFLAVLETLLNRFAVSDKCSMMNATAHHAASSKLGGRSAAPL